MTSETHPSRRWRRIALIACIGSWAAAFVGTHGPLPEFPPSIDVSDKSLHVLGYFALTAVFWLTLLAFGKGGLTRINAAVIVIPIYGILDEITQPLFHRWASVHDWVADLCGIVIAVTVLEAAVSFRRTVKRRKSND